MKKSVSIGLGIAGSLLVLALVAPWLISLNQYKSLIQDKAFEATGRKILINGDIRLGILPSPYARVTDIVVENPAGTVSEQFATIRAVDIGVKLAPLFSKEIQVSHITISEPAITMEVLADGSNNWNFSPPQKAVTEETEKATTGTQGTGAAFSIDNLSLEKAYIRYVNVPEKSQQTIGPIDGRFRLASLQGPLSGIGTLTVLDRVHVRFDATLESLPDDRNKNLPFRLGLGVMNNAATADLKGSVQTGDAVTAQVETAIAITDLEKILAAMSKDNKAPALPAYLKGKSSINGLLEWKDNTATINNLMLKAGSLEILGSFAAQAKDPLAIALDLDRVVLPPEMANGGTVPSAQTGKTAQKAALADTLKQGFAQASAFLDTALPKTGLDLVLTASQLPLPGMPVLRDFRMAVSSGDKGVTLQQLVAKLPGNTHIRLDGTLPARADGSIEKLVVNADITSDNPQQALGKKSEGKTPVALKAKTELTREKLHIAPMTLSQKGQSVQGEITYNPKSDVALLVALKGSALDLDSFLAGDKNNASTSTGNNAAAGSAAPKSDPLALLQGLKARLDVALGSLAYQGKTARDIAVQVLSGGKGLEIRTLRVGDLGGMVIEGSGQIASLNPLDGAVLKAQAKTPNLSATLKALGNAEAANLGQSAFDLSVSGNDTAMEMALNGTIDQGKITLYGKARDLNKAPSFAGTVDISHPETALIVRNFAGMKPAVNLGAFALKAELAYGTDTIKADKLLVKLGSAGTLQGHVKITPEAKGRKIDADLRADKLALAALTGDDTKTDAARPAEPASSAQAPWSREPVNLEALRNLNGRANLEIGALLYKEFVINNMKATALFADNTVTIERLGGSLFDAGTFNVQGKLAAGAANQAHRGDFAVIISKTDAAKLFAAMGSKPFAQGTLDARQGFAFNGASPYQIISSLNGDGQISVSNAIVNGLDLDALADRLDRPNSISDFAAIISQATAGGQTAIGDVTIPIAIRNGVVTIQDTTLKTQKTAMFLKGSALLPSKQVDMTGQITFVEQRNLPPLTLFIKGPMNNPQKNFDTRGFTDFYARKATEKLQEKAGDEIRKGLGKLFGTDARQPAASGSAAESAAPAAAAPAAVPAKPADPVKQLGNELLNNLLGGGR